MSSFTLPFVYPILDTATLERRGFDSIAAAEALLEGGAEILQFRHKSFWSRETLAAAGRVGKLCAEAGVLFVVNDRADYAALLGRELSNVALHLGQEDLRPEDARRVVGDATRVGYSTHNAAQMRLADLEPVDYLAFGPLFTTASKERPDPTVGVEAFRAARALTAKPVVAIGGITRDNALICREAGASSVAVIADLFPEQCDKISVRDRMAEWRRL